MIAPLLSQRRMVDLACYRAFLCYVIAAMLEGKNKTFLSSEK